MWAQFAVLGDELAAHLVSEGFELCYSKRGKYVEVFYFTDTEELYSEIEKYLVNVGY